VGAFLLQPGEAEVIEDSPDGGLIGYEGEHTQALAAASADEWIHVVDLRDHPGPAWSTPTLGGAGRREPAVTAY